MAIGFMGFPFYYFILSFAVRELVLSLMAIRVGKDEASE